MTGGDNASWRQFVAWLLLAFSVGLLTPGLVLVFCALTTRWMQPLGRPGHRMLLGAGTADMQEGAMTG